MFGQRSDIDHRRDDLPFDEREPIESDCFVMTDPDEPTAGRILDEEADEKEDINPDATTYGVTWRRRSAIRATARQAGHAASDQSP